ncbi:MAG: hypothetical protein ACTIOG_17680, partial [Pseudomonas helleri]
MLQLQFNDRVALSSCNRPSYGAGDVLIVHKGCVNKVGDHLAYDTGTLRLSIVDGQSVESSGLCVIGYIVEERFNDL